MSGTTGRNVLKICVWGAFGVLSTPSAWATNAQFQDFFFTVCATPTGALAERCAETDGALGNISGDSESSLNPSQALSSSDAAAVAAQQRSRAVREKLQTQRESDETGANGGATVDLGPFSLLLNARGSASDRDRRVDADAERGYELDEHSLELGVDYRANERLVYGAWLQWGKADLDFDADRPGVNFQPAAQAGDIETESMGLTAYFSAQVGERMYVDGSVSYTEIDLTSVRNAVFQESNRVISQVNSTTDADTEGSEWLVTLSGGYQGTFGAWNVSPYLGIGYMDTDLDNYREADLSGAGLALNVSLADQSLLFGQLGVNVSRAVSMEGWVLVPQLRVEYLHTLSRDRSRAQVQFVNDAADNTYQLRGDDPDDDHVLWAAGLFGILPNGWIPFVEYQAILAADDLDRYQISAGLRIEL